MKTIQYINKVFKISLFMALSNLKANNEGSYLGILWYIISPLFMLFLLVGVFLNSLGSGIENYSLYILVGLVMFNFFNVSTVESLRLFRQNRYLITSVNMPMESFVVSVLIKSFIIHFFEIITLIGFLVFFQLPVVNIIFYPLVLVLLVVFNLGCLLILSSLSVFVFDLVKIWSFLVKALWILTPLFYTIGSQSYLMIINMFNPLFYFITLARDLIVYSRFPEMWILFGSILYSVSVLLIGIYIFSRLKKKITEMV